MNRIEQMTTVRASAEQAMRLLRTRSRVTDWMAPDLVFRAQSVSPELTPGDRFRIEFLGGPGFDYTVEVISDRELVFDFRGPWCGRERWSFVPDGAESIVRRTYEATDIGVMPELVWNTAVRAMVLAHYKLELSRFKALLERDPGPRAEIPASTPSSPLPPPSFPIDDG